MDTVICPASIRVEERRFSHTGVPLTQDRALILWTQKLHLIICSVGHTWGGGGGGPTWKTLPCATCQAESRKARTKIPFNHHFACICVIKGGIRWPWGDFFCFFLFFESTILPGNIVVEAGFVQTERHSDEDVLYEDRLCWTRREGPLAQNNRSSFIQKEFNRLLNQNHQSIALWNLLWALGTQKGHWPNCLGKARTVHYNCVT